ncbi:MAG TPA: hypothetical protein VGW96_04035, partial [Candidatus Eremiobacteraceae bacterium]|nr:hypothetical protein [Candidatus Eremiobacteraceae bacterium]
TPSHRIVQYAASFAGMALTSGPTIWGTSQFNQQLFKYSAGGVLQQTYSNLPDESGIAVAPNGHLWLLSDRFSQAMDFDPKTATGIAYSLPSCGCFRLIGNPKFGPDGALYFTEGASNFVSNYPPSVGRITATGVFTEYPVYEPRSQPSGLTFDAHGTLWITDIGANKIGFLGAR